MDTLTLGHCAALLLSLLVLPRLIPPPDFVASASGDVEDLTLTRLGHVPGHGLYVCLARADGAAPDLALHYTASYTHGKPTNHTSCTATLTHRQDEPGLFCLPPCPGTEATHPRGNISLVVTGHDRTTGEAMAALVRSVALTDVAVEAVMITREYMEASQVEAAPRLRAVSVTVLDGAAGLGTGVTGKQAEAGGEAAVAEEAHVTEEDLQLLVINGHNHSEALRSLPGECGPPRLPGVTGVVCSVTALETLVDPEGQGPVASLLLLLASHSTAASTLLAITDVQVRVRQAGRGAVLVLWDRDASVQEFVVSVAPEVGPAHSSVTVPCRQRGSDCLASFEGLVPGRYVAEVSYERQMRVLLREPFLVESMAACGAEQATVGDNQCPEQ